MYIQEDALNHEKWQHNPHSKRTPVINQEEIGKVGSIPMPLRSLTFNPRSGFKNKKEKKQFQEMVFG
jgi:hypothetical protein